MNPPRYVTIEVRGLALDGETERPVLLLQHPTGRLILPLWIGAAEAAAIDVRLGGERPPRPLTHDLLHDVLDRLGARVTRFDLRRVEDGVFYGDLCVHDAQGRAHRFDCRPSDGVALALRADAPIRASIAVMQTARVHEGVEPRISLAIRADDADGRRRLLAALAELDPESLAAC